MNYFIFIRNYKRSIVQIVSTNILCKNITLYFLYI